MLSLSAVITAIGRMVGPLFGAFAYVYLSYEPDVLFGILADITGLSLVFWWGFSPSFPNSPSLAHSRTHFHSLTHTVLTLKFTIPPPPHLIYSSP